MTTKKHMLENRQSDLYDAHRPNKRTVPLSHRPGRCERRLAKVAGRDGAGRDIVTFPDVTHSGWVGRLVENGGLLFVPSETRTLPDDALLEFNLSKPKRKHRYAHCLRDGTWAG